MEPLSPNDPLWKLLGQARKVEARPNFAQNVLRAARQTPQEHGFLARLRTWCADFRPASARMAWAGAAVAAAIAIIAALPVLRHSGPSSSPASSPSLAQNPSSSAPAPTVADTPAAGVDLPPASDTQWADMQQFDALLAVYDTSELTDRDIHVLLY